MELDDLIYRWQPIEHTIPSFRGMVDETIRDGLQMPNCPEIELDFKIQSLDYMRQVGIEDVIIGMWRADQSADLEVLLQPSTQQTIRAWMLCRCDLNDVRDLAQFKQRSQTEFGLNLFISLSNIRSFAEGWQLEECQRRLFACLELGCAHFQEIRVAFEDATRTAPEVIIDIAKRLIQFGVSRICLADTAGVAIPGLAHRLVSTLLTACPELRDGKVGLEWHGHNDRGMAVASSLEALAAGVHYIHGTMCGIGERNGNTPLDIVMMNLSESPQIANRYHWQNLTAYRALIWHRFSAALAQAYPYFGENSFASATGTHVAAMHKAIEMDREDVARQLFAPPSFFSSNRQLQFVVSHLTGQRGVIAALTDRKLDASTDNVRRIQTIAAQLRRPLTDEELQNACIPSDPS